jgi:hypothetical protein
MSRYTIQLRTLVENGYKIFDFDYPMFDPKYKPVLEQKILDYYYFREIGLETPAQFKHFLKSKMNIIMPYYNQYYSSQAEYLKYDPYKNKNVTQTDKRTSLTDSSGKTDSSSKTSGNSTMDRTSSGTTTAQEIFSDTPQARLSGDKDYATNLTDNTGKTDGTEKGTSDSTETGTASSNSSGNTKTTDEYVSTIAGHDGMKYPTDILIGIRNTFINIDQMIIEDLAPLFLNIA